MRAAGIGKLLGDDLFMKFIIKTALAALGFAAAVTAALPGTAVAAGDGFSKKELAKMGVFLSNFSECSVKGTRDDIINNEIMWFGICHDFINNDKIVSMRDRCGDREVSAAHVGPERIIRNAKTYLNADLSEKDLKSELDNFMKVIYDGHTVCTDAFTQDFSEIEVTSAVKQKDGSIKVTGLEYHDEEKSEESASRVSAVIRPHTANGKKTWYLVSLDIGD